MARSGRGIDNGQDRERSGVSRRAVLIGSGSAALTGAVTWLVISRYYEARPHKTVAAVLVEATPTPPPVPRATEPPPPALVPAQRPLGLTVYEYQPVLIGNINDLELDVPVQFSYPRAAETAVLVRVGRASSGGIGAAGDVVAFSNICTHMGCPLGTIYSPEHKLLGPCLCHFTTFDLTNRGIVVIGQATEDLPQIQLELEDSTGDIYATGVMGLVYGHRSNLDALGAVE